MDDITDSLVRQFYVGDSSAWTSVINALNPRALRFLMGRFRSLSEDDLSDIVSEFEVDFYLKVKRGHAEADERIQSSPRELTPDEVEALKIHCCTVSTKFDLTGGRSFKNWVYQRLIWRTQTAATRSSAFQAFPLDDEEESLLHLPADLRGQLHHSPEQGALGDENTIKKLLRTVLEGDELIYLDVWFDEGPDPGARLVQDAIEKERGEPVNAVYVTNLKQSFLRKSFLKLLEHMEQVASLADLIQRLFETNNIQERMFVVMMDNIWAAFYRAEEIARLSRAEISPGLWARWRELTQRRKIQEEILAAAYRHYRLSSPLPRFCYLIELYSDTRFGGGVRRLFMEGGTVN
jgi:hypothetical protein